jgi:hypothetical protein
MPPCPADRWIEWHSGHGPARLPSALSAIADSHEVALPGRTTDYAEVGLGASTPVRISPLSRGSVYEPTFDGLSACRTRES